MCFDRELPASFVVEVAERLESDGVDQLWVIEDCFYTAGISLAATALARTESLVVGLGILPAVARNPAVTAMELATLANLAPGRLLAGIGHGVQEWMEQMGERSASPLTTLEEVFTVVGRLLRGENVSFDGREVTLSDVTLDAPPTKVPPLLAGVRGPKSLALAGRVADGLVLAEGAGPTYVAQSIALAGAPDPFRVSVFTALCVQDDPKLARRIMSPFICGMLADPGPAPLAHPHIEEIQERFAERGEDGVAEMPAEWWIEFGAIGSFDDALAHVEALAEAGAHDVALFAGPKVDYVREDLDHVANLAAALH
jgi:alkanesulfonate monooxygenase SsuD/methylene tetrahydromethanopterin reductase-like flavin-dependent oxidoreductase (luciferase family)